jgi:hypothetical protein
MQLLEIRLLVRPDNLQLVRVEGQINNVQMVLGILGQGMEQMRLELMKKFLDGQKQQEVPRIVQASPDEVPPDLSP